MLLARQAPGSMFEGWEDSMKVAVPSDTADGLNSIRAGHFGHAAYFTVVTIEDGKIVSTEVHKNVDHDTAGCGGVINYVLGLNVDAIIATGMGQRPYMGFTSGGVQVYSELETPMVGDVVNKFIAGGVANMDPRAACNHHH